MGRQCVICGKKSQSGNNVSHSMNATKRLWKPNLQKINILFFDKKTHKPVKKKKYVCVKCLKAGKVTKAV